MALNLNDLSGNSNTLTNNNGTTEVTTSLPFAASSIAADLEAGSNQYLSAADSVSLSITQSLTLQGWVKFETLPSGDNKGFIVKGTNTSDKRSYSLMFQEDSGTYYLRSILSSDGAYAAGNDVRVSWSPSTGVWYHVAMVYDHTVPEVKFFVNGVQQGTDQAVSATSLYNSDIGLEIGGTAFGLNYLDGQVDDIRIYNIARSEAQIAGDDDVEISSFTNVVAYYPFEVLGSPSSSLSPSASVSASISPSASVSPSASLSPSSSASASLSPSSSVSASPSPSSSISPSSSTSPSSSASASISPSSSVSRSVSPSPSAGYSLYSRGDEASLPANTNDLQTTYTDDEEANVATRNDIYIEQEAALQYMIHQFKDFVGSQTECSVQWEGKSDLAPNLSAVYLEIYNRNTSAWEQLDSDNTAGADVDFELEGKIADLTNYKDVSNVITCRVYQLAI